MAFSFSIPTISKVPLELRLDAGEMLFILGANGTGKSSLMQAFASANSDKVRRVSAHRQIWFRSGSPEFTGKQRTEYENRIFHYDKQANARWMDDYSEQRAQMAIYDLVNSENKRSRNIARAVDEKNTAEIDDLSNQDGAFRILNRILRLANLDIAISIEENDEIMATRRDSKPYSIAKLSDGERNAILIAANILTVSPGTLLLIDEPERHLHRSIVSPLLSLLLKERPDCALIVSTHEPLLPVDNPGSNVLLTRACVYESISESETETGTFYDIDFLESSDGIDDDLKSNILGERRKIVFVEGVEHSLDKPLYSLLFPNASVVAKANCREVENAVVGIKGTSELHWVQPFGLVDNDSSQQERIIDLQTKGVIPLTVYSVESIYYHPELQKLAGEKLAAVVDGNLTEMLDKANRNAIKAIRASAGHLSSKLAEKSAREKVFSLLPKKGEIANGGKRSVEIDFAKCAEDEKARIMALIDANNFTGILQRYPIRESPALDAIAKALNYSNRTQYEAAVRNLLVHDSEAVKLVQSLLGPLPSDLVA